MTYLDVASAAPWHPAALAAHARFAKERFGDPARAHAAGRAARDLLEQARAAVATSIGTVPERLALHIGRHRGGAPGGARGRGGEPRVGRGGCCRPRSSTPRCTRPRTRPASTTSTCGSTNSAGVDLDALAAALEGGALLVNVQHANHEVGTVQPVAEAARLAHEAGALVHVDACQTVGRLPVDLGALGADFLSFSAAKLGGGRGVGRAGVVPGRALRAAPVG